MAFLSRLAEIRIPILTDFFSLLTYLGDGMPIVIIVFILYWCVDKNLAKKVGLSVAFGGLLNGVLKATFCIPRPWVRDTSFKAIESAKARATGYSFPSGHVSNAVCTYGTIGVSVKKWAARIGCFLLILLIAFSRMYLGVHTPSDVIVSFCVSVIVVLLVVRLYDKLNSLNERQFLWFVVCSSLLAVLTVVYIRFKPYEDGYSFTLSKDGYLACGMVAGLTIGWYLERRFLNFDVKAVWWFQIIKVVAGLVSSLLLLELLGVLVDLLPSIQEIVYFVRYLLIVLWAVFGYPFIFNKIKAGKKA